MLGASATLALLALAYPRSGAPPQDAAPTPEARAASVEPVARCADCHPAIVASWRETGMARALEPLRPGELADLEPVVESGTGFRYRFEEGSSSRLLVETYAYSPAGSVHRDSAPLAFAIGAGELDRAFACVRGNRLWFAPLEVVSAAGDRPRHAALAPGHMIAPGMRFANPITRECLACHTSAPPPRVYPLNARPEGWEPVGITCVSCHADTDEHVAWRTAALSGDDPEGADPLTRFAELERHERMSVCAGCHLQGDARIELDADRVGPPPPGGDLLAARAVFVAAEPTQDVGFVSHVERLALSPCYLESSGFEGGGLSCETCHDPHRSVFDAAERARTRAACTTCHADGAPHDARASACGLEPAARSGKDCVACHMRETPVFDVASVRIHDHFIRVDPGEPSPPPTAVRTDEAPDGAWKRFRWPDVPPPAHVDDPGILMMGLSAAGHLERALALTATEPSPTVAALPMYHHVRGSLLDRAGRPEAVAAYERALALDPALGESANNLGLLLARVGRAREGYEVLSALIERHPLADGALRNRALVARSLGDDEGFVRDLERALRIVPDAVVARALARYHAALGDEAATARWDAEALRLDPRLRLDEAEPGSAPRSR